MKTGRVLWYSDRDECGIIREWNGLEWYFDISVMSGLNTIASGQLVTFNHNQSIKHCRCGKDIKILKEGAS